MQLSENLIPVNLLCSTESLVRSFPITFDRAGTTRDRVFELLELKRKQFLLVDTTGLDFSSSEDLETDIRKQSQIAINESDIIVFVIDLSVPLSADDFLAAKMLRQSNKPVIFVGSKNDRRNEEYYINSFELGFGEPICLSAVQNRGINGLTNAISKQLTSSKLPKLSILLVDLIRFVSWVVQM